jgi:hypothetical protein
MIDRFIKTGLRKAFGLVRRVKRWTEEGPASVEQRDDGLAYNRLNAIFATILSDPSRIHRPNYTWGVLHAAQVAKAIGINRISLIEFGVAGGNGLVSLEHTAVRVEEALDIGIDVYGFDTGKGLPKPRDYRDLPSLWREGDYRMDVEKLKKTLQRAELILGPVETSVPAFLSSKPAPVGFVAFDLDYYSSTMASFKLLETDVSLLLPRIYCYFDDIMGHIYSDFTGERLAIREFNNEHRRKISPIYGLKYFLPKPYAEQVWTEMMYIAHIFDHPLYSANDGLVKPSRNKVTELDTDRAIRLAG